uniref:Ferroptosis suppressor protein 1 n=1 Tax=Xiphophorus couchianus TaxID=32473 RepID=A0A3B5L383_9TELE
MGGQVSVPDGVHVVVVGGGFGGIAAAQQLRSAGFGFTLLDIRDSFHHNVAALRASVQPGFAQRTFIPYAETFGTSFLQGGVEQVDPEQQLVVLQGGREVQYSHLILCTGSDGPFPGKFNTKASMQDGVTAYEDMVGQVRQRGAEVSGGTGRRSLGVCVCVCVCVCVSTLTLQSLPATGTAASLASTCRHLAAIKGSMAADGALKVNQYLQVEGFSNIFAVGDCADLREAKLAYHAGLHAYVAVSNIISSLSGKPLTPYRNVSMLLAMGRDDGVGQFNGIRLPRWLVALGKSRDLMLWKSWREMQQKQP